MRASDRELASFHKQMFKQLLSTFLLWIISKKPAHGYEIVKLFGTDDHLKIMRMSQLYPLLKELTKQGFIKQKTEFQRKRKKKVYMILKKGREMILQTKNCICGSQLRRQYLQEMVS